MIDLRLDEPSNEHPVSAGNAFVGRSMIYPRAKCQTSLLSSATICLDELAIVRLFSGIDKGHPIKYFGCLSWLVGGGCCSSRNCFCSRSSWFCPKWICPILRSVMAVRPRWFTFSGRRRLQVLFLS